MISLFYALSLLVSVEPTPLSLFHIAQLKYSGGEWNPRPHAVRHLLAEVDRRTSIVTAHEATAVAATDPRLADWPFLYWAGDGAMSPLHDNEVLALRRYVKSGGMIFVDAADDNFEQSARHELQRILPEGHLGQIPEENVLYKTFYLVSSHGGRSLKHPYLEAMLDEDRLAVVLSSNDHGGAWARDDFGRYDFEVSPGGEGQREMALRFGINLVMYALCLDYKDDQVHIPFIMRRRK